LHKLASATGDEHYSQFITNNAQSIWDQDSSNGFSGENWQGPVGKSDFVTQTSAVDCLIAAAAIENC
jgi:hypothetical protein